MTNEQKSKIIEFRQSGLGYKAIAKMLGVSLNTVKSYCQRHNLQRQTTRCIVSMRFCMECSKEIPQAEHRKTKKFCCDKCRSTWWRKHSSLLRTPSKKIFICPVCQNTFMAYSSTKQKFCSRTCYAKSREAANV